MNSFNLFYVHGYAVVIVRDKITLVCAPAGNGKPPLGTTRIIIPYTMGSLPALRLCGRISLQRPVVTSVRQPRLLRATSQQLRMVCNSPAPRFAEGEDPQQLGSDTAALQQQGWTLDTEGMGVTKTFYFKSYFKAVVS